MNVPAPDSGEPNDTTPEIDHVQGRYGSSPDGQHAPLPALSQDRKNELVTALPFVGLVAPAAVAATPPLPARWLAFAGVLVGGSLGGLIGYGTGDLLANSEIWAALGALVGGLIGATGVGIVASLTLRAMNEWTSVQHPEAHLEVSDLHPDPAGEIDEAN